LFAFASKNVPGLSEDSLTIEITLEFFKLTSIKPDTMTGWAFFVPDTVLVDINHANHLMPTARAINISSDFIKLATRFWISNIEQMLRPINGFELFCLKRIKPNSFAVEAAIDFNSGTSDLF
jgi:hypothetical protein